MFSGLPCECHIAHIARIARSEWHSLPAAPARHRSHTPARRVVRIIRIIRSYGHAAAWHCATLPRLPGIACRACAKVGILPPRSEFRLRSTPRSVFPKNPSPGQRRRSVSEAVLAGATDIVFFHHSHAQPSILAWAQNCSTQSWREHRIHHRASAEVSVRGSAPRHTAVGVFFTTHTPCR